MKKLMLFNQTTSLAVISPQLAKCQVNLETALINSLFKKDGTVIGRGFI